MYVSSLHGLRSCVAHGNVRVYCMATPYLAIPCDAAVNPKTRQWTLPGFIFERTGLRVSSFP